MDYIVIGSIGFAQVGQEHYGKKREIEKQVINELVKIENIFQITSEFKDLCYKEYKTFQHDFGSYDELCLVYDNAEIDDWIDNDIEKNQRFWNWVNEMESYDFEQQILIDLCESKFEGKNTELGFTEIEGIKTLQIVKKY